MNIIAKYHVSIKLPTTEDRAIYEKYLAKTELVLFSYANQINRVIFTDRKIIAIQVDKRSILEPKFMFIPYYNISSFSVESMGKNINESEFSLLLPGIGLFEVCFENSIDCVEIGHFLSNKILAKEKTYCI